MTDSSDVSYLTDIAKIEQCEIEKTAKLAARCKERVDEALEQAQSDLAAIPIKVQEKRREAAQAAKEKADKQVVELVKEADAKQQLIEDATAGLEPQVLDLVLSTILPSETGDGS